jgi:hypothetical protein
MRKAKLKKTKWLLTESLTPVALQLLLEARKKFGTLSCWTMNGSVFVKDNENTVKRISRISDLNECPAKEGGSSRKLRPRSVRQS